MPQTALALLRIIAAEVDGLAQLRQSIIKRLAGLALQQRQEQAAPALQKIGRPPQRIRALAHRHLLPTQKPFCGRLHGVAGHVRTGLFDLADGDAAVLRAGQRPRLSGLFDAVDERSRLAQCKGRTGFDLGQQGIETGLVAEFDPR